MHCRKYIVKSVYGIYYHPDFLLISQCSIALFVLRHWEKCCTRNKNQSKAEDILSPFFISQSDPWYIFVLGVQVFCRTCTLKNKQALGRTSLDEWSARHRDLYLTTQNIHKNQISTPPPPPSSGIRTRNPIKRVAANTRFKPRGHQDQRRHSRRKNRCHMKWCNMNCALCVKSCQN
jgi:hypothetical protein